MEQIAKVTAVSRGYATVEVARRSACDGCHKSAEGCAMCALLGDKKTMSARAADPIGVSVGDTVEVATADARVLGYAALVFLCPILLAMAGYAAAGAVGAGVGFAGALIGVCLYSRRVGKTRCDVTIVRVLDAAHGDE